MNAFDVMVPLLILRVILPVGLLLLIGELSHRHDSRRFRGV